MYAAKNLEPLCEIDYEKLGIHGEVYLWGTVVEHRLGWRAQFAYPKSLFLPPDRVPIKITELDCKRRSENRPRHAVRAGDAAEEK